MGLRRQQRAAGLPTLHLPHSQGFEFPYRVKDEKTFKRACGVLDRLRPGHGLSSRSWKAWYITTATDARALAAFLPTVPQTKGFDFETRGWRKVCKRTNLFGGESPTKGVSPLHPANQSKPVIFQISWGLDSYVVRGEFIDIFRKWLSSDDRIDFANAGYEVHTCANVGVFLPRVHRDVLDMDHTWKETTRQYKHNLKDCMGDYLGLEVRKFGKLKGAEDEDEFDGDFETLLETDLNGAMEYASLDPLGTSFSADLLEDFLRSREVPSYPGWCAPRPEGWTDWDTYQYMERTYHRTISLTEAQGMPLSRARAREYADEMSGQINRLDGEIYELAGRSVDVDSAKELAAWFFDELNLPVRRTSGAFLCLLCGKQVTTRTNNVCKRCGVSGLVNRPAVDGDVLAQLADEGLEAAKKIVERRGIHKKLSTWVDPLYRLAKEDGYGHPALWSNLVVSGRLSGGGWLTTPGDLRDLYGWDEDLGEVLVRLDYSQLELRILAHLADDKAMKAAFNSNKDLHCYAGAMVLIVEECPEKLDDEETRERYYLENEAAKVKDDENDKRKRAGLEPYRLTDREKICLYARKRAKAVNFGLIYGQGVPALAASLGISLSKAKEVVAVMESVWAGASSYFESRVARAVEDLSLRTLLGRRKQLPDFKHAPDTGYYKASERLVKNQPCQGGGADVIRMAMILAGIDMEAGGPVPAGRIGIYGCWIGVPGDERYVLDWDRLPRGWQEKKPAALAEGLGTLGRLKAKMVLQCHDELLFRGPREHADAIAARAKTIMEDPFGGELDFTVALKVTAGFGNSWKEAA